MNRLSLLAAAVPAAALALAGAKMAPDAHASAEAEMLNVSDTSRFTPAVGLAASDLLYARVLSADGRSVGQIDTINFDSFGAPEWVWLRGGGWTLRAPIGSLSQDRVTGALHADRTFDQLRRLAQADPETRASTATEVSAGYAPASRLLGLPIVSDDDTRIGFVHSVQADMAGSAESLVVERRFGLLSAKMERYSVPAEMVAYLPVSQTLVIREMPQPVMASMDGALEG